MCLTKRGTVHPTVADATDLCQRIKVRFQAVGIDS
jgi:hypothetical protein